jgi:hypothetical protein
MVTALAAAPFLLPGWLPFTDIPEHEAAMASIAHFGDPAYRISEYYRMGWSTSQYLLTHLVGAGLVKMVGSAEVACRVMLIGLAIAWVQSCRMLLRAFGLDQRLAMMSAVLFWNRSLVVGFIPYVSSLPVMFATVAVFVAGGPVLSRRRSIALCCLGVVVFYTHASAFTLLASTVASLAVAQAYIRAGVNELAPGRRIAAAIRDALLHLMWLVPATALAAVWIIRGRFTARGSTIHDTGEIGTMNSLRAVKLIATYSHDIWPSHVDDWIGICWWFLFCVVLVGTIRRARAAPSVATTPAPQSGTIVPLLVSFIVYLATPFRVGSGVLLNVRMAPVLAFFALLGLRPQRDRQSSVAIALTVVLSLVQCADNIYEMRRLQRDVVGLDALLQELPKGSRMITLNFSGFDPALGHFTPWLHIGSHHRALNGGVASFSFSELPHWSVQYTPAGQPPAQAELSWGQRPCLYRNERDGAWFDYVLVRGSVNPFRDDPPGPRWKERGRTEKYVLYEKDPSRPPLPRGRVSDEGPCAAPLRTPVGPTGVY